MLNSSEEEWVLSTIRAVMTALAQSGHIGDGELIAREVLTALNVVRKRNEKAAA
jgi:hypothetical protein